MPVSFLILILILGSAFIALRILKRSRPNQRAGCWSLGYITLIIAVLIGLSLMLVSVFAVKLDHIRRLPYYDALVVDAYSYESESSKRDSDGRTRSRTVTMYQPIVTFKDEKGVQQTLRVDISSSRRLASGKHLKVAYESGMTIAEEISWSKWLLLGGMALMLLITSYFVVAAVAYAFGAKMGSIQRFGIGILLYILLPTGMLGLLTSMVYAVFQHANGQNKEMPLWALVVCIFFSLVLLLSFGGYCKMVLGNFRKRKWGTYEERG